MPLFRSLDKRVCLWLITFLASLPTPLPHTLAASAGQASGVRIPLVSLRGGSRAGVGQGGGAGVGWDSRMPARLQRIRGGGGEDRNDADEEEGYGEVKFGLDDFMPANNKSWGDVGPAPQMHADEALRRVKEGCSLLLLDFPTELDFGVDMQSWITGPKFKGLKMVPSGLHFMYWSAGHGIHQGIWFQAIAGRVLVHKWDESLEDLAPQSSMTEEERERYVHGVKQFDFDRGMGPYPQGESKWRDLTHFIDEAVLENAGVPMGSNGMTCHIMPGDPDEDAKSDNRSTAVETYWPALARTAFFSRIQLAGDREALKGVAAEELTDLQMDSSPLLERALKKHYKGDPKALLGELQLAFVNFVLLSSYSGLEQWKRIISLLCNSGDTMRRRPSLFYNFLSCLEYQLLYAPEDWFRDELTEDNFLKDSLVSLHDRIDDLAVGPGAAKPQIKQLAQRSSKFFKFVRSRFDLKIRRGKVQHAAVEGTSDQKPVEPHVVTQPHGQDEGRPKPEIDIEYVRKKYNRRMNWAVDGSKLVDTDEEEGEASSDHDEEGEGPMVVDFVDETQTKEERVAANKPLKRGFFGERRERRAARQEVTGQTESGGMMEYEESQRVAQLQEALHTRQKGLEEAIQQVRDKHTQLKKAEGASHASAASGLRSNATDHEMGADSAQEVTARMRELNLHGRPRHPVVQARSDGDRMADRLADRMADGAADEMADELADQLAAKAAEENSGDMSDQISEELADDIADELLDEELDTDQGVRLDALPRHDGMHAMAGQFVSVQSGHEVRVPNPHYRPPEDATVRELPQDSFRATFHPEEAKRLEEKMKGPYRGPLRWIDKAQAQALLNAQQHDVDNMYASVEQQGTGYLMSEESGILVDLRGPEMLVFGPPELAQQLINVSAMEHDYGKPVVYVDALEPERRKEIVAKARMQSQQKLKSGEEKMRAPTESEQAVVVGQGQGTLAGEETRDQLDAVKLGTTGGFEGASGWGGARVSGWGVSKARRQGELNDYSCFDKLQVSEDEAEEEIHMCPRCDFKRPADLEVKNKHNGTVVDRMCSVCAEYADDDGTPLKRDPWMLEEPPWWKEMSQKDPKEEEEEMLRAGYVPLNRA